MNARLRLSTLLALAALPVPAAAEQDASAWLNVTVHRPVGRVTLSLEVQPRVRDGASRLDQALVRPLAMVRVTDRLSLGQGYAHVVTGVENGRDRHENRSFQQANWAPGRVGAGDLSFRTRLEQRWLNDGRDTGWRLRQQVRYRLPLRGAGRGPAALAHVEGFLAVNATDWGARRGFDQVRSFAGIELPLRGRSTAEIGYLNQTLDRPGSAVRVNHVGSLTLMLR